MRIDPPVQHDPQKEPHSASAVAQPPFVIWELPANMHVETGFVSRASLHLGVLISERLGDDTRDAQFY
jgi:hypothetical protein